jgi:hypothetical protein
MADLPVIQFIRERLAEGDTTFETREGTGFFDLFVKPQELMLQPLLTSMETSLTSQSIRRIRALTDPNSFDEGLVDDAAGNFYVDRDLGDFARATIRVFYDTPVDREFPAFSAEFASGTLSFFNEFDFVITAAQMQLQSSGSLFFIDIPARAQVEGSDFNLDTTAGVTFITDTAAISSTLLSSAVGGLPKETNTQILDRTKNSIGVRDLETIKGINAILREKFPALREILAVGMGDPEMMRDILYNAHVGGKTDIYLKTPALVTKTTSVIGLVFDTTRELKRNVHKQLIDSTGAPLLSFSDPNADLGTPFIVSPSVVVKSDTVETAAQFFTASVPAVTGIDLTLHEWIKLQVDENVAMNIKVSGATVAATQRFEIINAINATTGLSIASPSGTDLILVKSPTKGVNSQLVLTTPDGARTNGTLTLIPSAGSHGYPSIGTFSGVGATEYLENIDYAIQYDNGKIVKLFGSAIQSGDIVAQSPGNGNGSVTTSSNVFTTPLIGGFSGVSVGDKLTITVSTGVALGDYVVSEIIDPQNIRILGMAPTGVDASVHYVITSEQVVVIDYRYNPLSIDVGKNILLEDGITRGIRPGRDNYSIKDVAFIDIVSIEEIDSDTGEGLGTFLVAPGGFGFGGFGLGGFGNSAGGDYRFIVNRPTERFSAFEDSLITFDATLFGKSYKVSYLTAPEIEAVHVLARNDLERVTGADVLPKNFVPGFVTIPLGIRRDPTNLTTPSDDGLATLVSDFVDLVNAGAGLQASDISKLLEDQGVDSVRTPFVMTMKVLNTDGSTTIVDSTDILIHPAVTLLKQTDNFVSPRLVHLYPRDVTVSEVI